MSIFSLSLTQLRRMLTTCVLKSISLLLRTRISKRHSHNFQKYVSGKTTSKEVGESKTYRFTMPRNVKVGIKKKYIPCVHLVIHKEFYMHNNVDIMWTNFLYYPSFYPVLHTTQKYKINGCLPLSIEDDNVLVGHRSSEIWLTKYGTIQSKFPPLVQEPVCKFIHKILYL